MKLGAILPNSGEFARRPGLGSTARTAEAAGADSVWVSDHLLLVDQDVLDYPFSADGRPTWSPRTDWYEALACCAFLAAVTTQCRIGTATLILPQRNVLQLAKETATIDQLSAGRLELGVGVGWSEAEMTALGYDFASRGARFEQLIAALRMSWSGRTSALHSDQLDIAEGLMLHPVPVAPTGPPILVGGMSPVAIRRAATIGDGWLAIAFSDAWDEADLISGLALLAKHAVGRTEPPRTLLKLHCRDGDVERLGQCLLRARALGFDELLLDLPWSRGLDASGESLNALIQLARS